MSFNMKANFYPAKEPKNGYIGKADLTIAEAIRINGISVFENAEGKANKYHIAFPGYGEGEAARSYVVPKSTEAHAEMLAVVAMAVEDPEYHFGHQSGKMNPQLTVSGRIVNEPYANGRFTVDVGDLCAIQGIKTREGTKRTFVDMPELPSYEKDGEKVYPDAVEGLVWKYEKDGKQESKDFGLLISNLVRGERNKLLGRHPSIEEQVDNAAQRTAQAAGMESPAPEKAR